MGQWSQKHTLCAWMAMSFLQMEKHIESLSPDQFTIYAIDAPGHGNSEGKISNVPLFEKAIQAVSIHIGEIHSIVSHSIGSFSALYFVDQNPDRQPKKLVALASPNSIEDFLECYFKKLKLTSTTISNFKSYFTKYTAKETSYFTLANVIKDNDADGLIIHNNEDKTLNFDYSKKLYSL